MQDDYQFKTITPTATREQIFSALNGTFDAYKSGEKSYSIAIPPRYGKTNLMYILATELRESHNVPFVLALAPWNFLVDQLTGLKKRKDHRELYKMHKALITNRARSFRNAEWWRTIDKKKQPHIWGATLRLAYNRKEELANSIKVAVECGQSRPIIIVDEAHIISDRKALSETLNLASSCGAFVVLLTGTPYKSSKERIWGFNVTDVTTTSIEGEVRKKRIDPQFVRETTSNGENITGKMTADFTMEWKEAWEEGALAQSDVYYVDNKENLVERKGEKIKLPLSKLNNTEVLRNMRTICTDSDLTTTMTAAFVKELVSRKNHPQSDKSKLETGMDIKDTAGIYVVGSDVQSDTEEKETNRHAKTIMHHIKEEGIKRKCPLNVKIATMANNGGDNLKSFINDTDIDVLIVKLMGLVGLDMKRLNVLGTQSSIRQGPTIAQLFTRIMTPDPTGVRPIALLPQDCLMVEAWDFVVGENSQEVDIEEKHRVVVDSTIYEDEQEPEENQFKMGTGSHVKVTGSTEKAGDTKGVGDYSKHSDTVSAAKWEYAPTFDNTPMVEMIRILPKLSINMEGYMAYLAELRKNNVEEDVDTEAEIKCQRERFNSATKAFANSNGHYATGREEWVDIRKTITSKAKIHAGFPNVDLKDETDADRVKMAADYVIAELKSRKKQ